MSPVNSSRRIPNADRTGWSVFRSDLFGRTKISEPFTLFDSSHRYQQNLDFSYETSGTASTAHLPNESSMRYTIGTASGDLVSSESKRVFPYQPGKSLQVMQTFVMAAPKVGLRQRAGYFSRQNGVFLEQTGTDIYIVLRSYISGAVVDTRIAKSDWNIDRLDGSGPTGISLDLTKAQILITEYEWLGVGSVRVGFMIDGVFAGAHQFNHSNVISSVYMTTATLPVRYEIENTAATASSSTFKQICATVISNGGYARTTESWNASRSSSANISTSYFPVVAIRMASGRTDSVVVPSSINVLGTSQGDYQYAVIKNPDSITGGSWVLHAPKNNVEYNASATAMSGGTVVDSGLFASSNQAQGSVALNDGFARFDLQLGRTNATNPTSDVIVLAVRSLSGTQSAVGSISWHDLV